MKFQLPIGNRTADAQKSAAILQLEDSKIRMRAAQDQIGLEVRDALREIQTARKRIDAASETIRFNEEQLATIRTQFTAGLTSSYLVLQAIDELDKARSTERRAVMDYNVGQSKLRLADASNLERYGIELRKPTR
jgi:outer membrane protein TolC